MSDISERTVLVAGSSRGIGAAVARRCAEAEARVIVHGRTGSDSLWHLAHELNATAVFGDGTEPAAVTAIADNLAESGVMVDTLVCALGAVTSTPVLSSSDRDWVQMYRANVLGPLHFVQSFADALRRSGRGRVVLVSSIRGVRELASPEVAAYSAAKAALLNLMVSLAKEFAGQVAVNAVVPGFAATDMSATWSPQVLAQIEQAMLGRPAHPNEIAEPIVFLASNAASFMTGEVLHVEGGYASNGK